MSEADFNQKVVEEFRANDGKAGGPFEGMPLVLLEAMQWRVPILATSVGAIPELLDEGRRGRLTPPNDLAALTLGLQGMMSTGEGAADRDVAAAHAAVSQHYSSARMADEYFSAYGAIT